MSVPEWLFVAYCAGVLGLHALLEVLARAALRASARLPTTAAPEAVTLIKPVYRVDAHSEACFTSWLTQDYPGELQVVFSLQDPEDPALELLERLVGRPGLAPFEVLVNPIEPGYHGKTSNLLHGVRAARHGVLVLSDADIEAPPETLGQLVGALQGGAGLVGCLVVHDRPADFWGRIYAAVWNVACVYLCGPTLAFTPFGTAPGGTVALRAPELRALGGVEALRGWITDDLALNLAAQRAGLGRGLGPTVRSPVGRLGWAGWRDKLSRGAAGSREIPGYPLTPLVVLAFYSYLVAIPAFAWSGNAPMVALGLGTLLARMAFGGLMTRRSEGRFRLFWDLLVLDPMLVAVFLRVPFARRFTWDGVAYERGGPGELQVRP